MHQHRAKLRPWIVRYASKLTGLPVGTGELSANGQRDYRDLLVSLAERLTRSIPGHQILAGVTRLPVPAAWAYRNAMGDRVHVVLATQRMFTIMQYLVGASHEALLEQLDSSAPPNELRSLWGELPPDALHAAGFARMLGHVAMVLLAHHEFAHIVIGHTLVGMRGAVDETEELTGAYSLPAALLAAAPEPVLRSHAFEMDADIHALLWTDDYMQRFDPHSAFLDKFDSATKAVHLSFGSRDPARRFMLITAAWVMFLALGGTELTAKSLSSGTHPPSGMRLAMMLASEFDLARRRDATARPMHAAATFGAQIKVHAWEPHPTLSEVIEDMGYGAALREWDTILAHQVRLAAVRRSHDPYLRPRRLSTGLPEASWW